MRTMSPSARGSRTSRRRTEERMRPVLKWSTVVTLSVGLALTAGGLPTAASPASRGAPARDESRIRELNIGFFERRLARDPSSAYDLAQLAALHLQRGRERGDPGDVIRAEQLARTSLASRALRNTKGYTTLVSTLLTEHRFTEARVAAERLLALDSTSVPSRATLAEIEMELGDYGAARTLFGALFAPRPNGAGAPRPPPGGAAPAPPHDPQDAARAARVVSPARRRPRAARRPSRERRAGLS